MYKTLLLEYEGDTPMKKQSVLFLSAVLLMSVATIQPAQAFKFLCKKAKPVVEAPAKPAVEVKTPEVVKPAVAPVAKPVTPAVKPAVAPVKPAVKPVVKAPVKK